MCHDRYVAAQGQATARALELGLLPSINAHSLSLSLRGDHVSMLAATLLSVASPAHTPHHTSPPVSALSAAREAATGEAATGDVAAGETQHEHQARRRRPYQ